MNDASTFPSPEVVTGKRFERSRLIRFSHCDPAGIVFYPQYFVIFNSLIEDWFTAALNVSYANLIMTRRVGVPLVRLETDFVAISRMGDEVTLGLQVQRLGTRSLSLLMDCRLGDAVRVRMRAVIVTTSLDTHRAIPIPDDLRAAIERFQF